MDPKYLNETQMFELGSANNPIYVDVEIEYNYNRSESFHAASIVYRDQNGNLLDISTLTIEDQAYLVNNVLSGIEKHVDRYGDRAFEHFEALKSNNTSNH